MGGFNEMIVRRMAHYARAIFIRIQRILSPEIAKFHDESVHLQKLLVKNDEVVFNEMYSRPNLLRHYLVDARLGFYRSVAARVDSLFPGVKEKASCIDVGCGTGHLLFELRNLEFSGRLVGLDAAAAAEEQVRSHGADIEFYSGYLSEQVWRSEFDLVLCTEVLEHCPYPGIVVQDMIRVAKPGGMIVITVPDGRKDTWEGHIHFWSPESFKLFIESFGKKASFDYFEDVNFCAIYC
jgi:SAM-dependent methyltransferase